MFTFRVKGLGSSKGPYLNYVMFKIQSANYHTLRANEDFNIRVMEIGVL